eukprot:TRINITY_DN3513_c0_g1_i1.p1 TRINITY_DN3513_c0_g1~~TRINITY_DN3513_c0_g1_i1.p1  ORF type:complete len:353 (+),score=47.59 TRINITY_DN3513_c0_g1_i1:108-1166(+)
MSAPETPPGHTFDDVTDDAAAERTDFDASDDERESDPPTDHEPTIAPGDVGVSADVATPEERAVSPSSSTSAFEMSPDADFDKPVRSVTSPAQTDEFGSPTRTPLPARDTNNTTVDVAAPAEPRLNLPAAVAPPELSEQPGVSEGLAMPMMRPAPASSGESPLPGPPEPRRGSGQMQPPVLKPVRPPTPPGAPRLVTIESDDDDDDDEDNDELAWQQESARSVAIGQGIIASAVKRQKRFRYRYLYEYDKHHEEEFPAAMGPSHGGTKGMALAGLTIGIVFSVLVSHHPHMESYWLLMFSGYTLCVGAIGTGLMLSMEHQSQERSLKSEQRYLSMRKASSLKLDTKSNSAPG